MKVTITYRLEEGDEQYGAHFFDAYHPLRVFDVFHNPSMKDVGAMCNETPPPEIRALRMLMYSNQFTKETAAAAIAHLRAVAQLAYRHREHSTSPASSTLRKATVRAFQVANAFEAYVKENLIQIP